ncbi:MAG: ribonuclease P protein component [Candidatus Paceibacterota bacterium]|jgi:ribonuclease P protein component
MFPKKYRAGRADIGETMKTGLNIPGTFLYAKISRKDSDRTSFAIVVPKRVEKTSVGRHGVKRKIRGFVEEKLPDLNPKTKKTMVFFVKDSKNPSFLAEARKDMENIMRKANLLV